MCNYLLIPLVNEIKRGNMTVFNTVYEEFKKLIMFYAAKSGGEDMQSELNLFLIELLYSIETKRFECDESTTLKNYIAVCIRNRYISVSKTEQAIMNCSNPLYENSAVFIQPYDEKIVIERAFDFLTEKQKRVLVYRYHYGYSDCEIAEKLNIKRQAVQRMRKRAFSILRTKL